nr:ATP-binding domain-containing protein [Acetatifactor sp.]
EIDKVITELDIMQWDMELLKPLHSGKSVIRFHALKKQNSDDDSALADDTDIPFQIAYAVSIHKAQGLEYDSVKVIITEEVDRMITHNIFYTAVTRSKKDLTIYWSPETQEKIISAFETSDIQNDATIFAAQTNTKKKRIK